MVEKKTTKCAVVKKSSSAVAKKTTTKSKMSKEEVFTGKTEVEVLLGIGWLLKEGKVKGDAGKVVLA